MTLPTPECVKCDTSKRPSRVLLSDSLRALASRLNEGRTLLAFGGILIAIVVLACAGMTLLACAGMYAWDRPACHQWAAINNVPAQWHLRTGCLVQMQDGVWYGVENVRWVGLAP